MKTKTADWLARTIILPALVLLIGVILLAVRHHSRVAPTTPASEQRAQQLPVGAVAQSVPVDPQIRQSIDGMIGAGLVRVDSDSHRAWIEPSTWLQADPPRKEQLTRALAAYVSPGAPMVTLFDNRSGREIASYGPLQGFKVE